MNSKKRISAWIEQDIYNEVESHRKRHGLKNWTKAFHSYFREMLQRIKELESEREKDKSIRDYLKEKGLIDQIEAKP